MGQRIVYKNYWRCASQDSVINGLFGSEMKIGATSITFNGLRNSDGTYSSGPAWFTESSAGFPAFDATWQMTPPAEDNAQYSFSWTLFYWDNSQMEYLVNLNMIDYCRVDIGCREDTRVKPLSALCFLTRQGGWGLFVFNGKKSFKVTIPEAKQYISTGYVTYNTSRRGVFDGETLTAGGVSIIELDQLQALKESIQVYYVENLLSDGEQIYKPVILKDGDFEKRRTDEKTFEISVSFIYAEELQMQSQ